MTRCWVVARAWHLPFAGVALCLCVCESWHLADRCGSASQGLCTLYRFSWIIPDQLFAAVFANPGGFKLIVADQLAPVLVNLCGFKLIVTDQFAGVQRIKSPALPSLQKLSGEYLSTDLVQSGHSS